MPPGTSTVKEHQALLIWIKSWAVELAKLCAVPMLVPCNRCTKHCFVLAPRPPRPQHVPPRDQVSRK
ncbi:hypothetical protein VTL71DRAFT_8429 [Oculimacula yallundae]|uniref:Uncharacterized protein n=1 Tax=Oculimacula yallundae TaxID=86028 RepID=A0ABR4CXK7_9HELO